MSSDIPHELHDVYAAKDAYAIMAIATPKVIEPAITANRMQPHYYRCQSRATTSSTPSKSDDDYWVYILYTMFAELEVLRLSIPVPMQGLKKNGQPRKIWRLANPSDQGKVREKTQQADDYNPTNLEIFAIIYELFGGYL